MIKSEKAPGTGERHLPCQIILTRPASEGEAMVKAITDLGVQVCLAPVIEFISFIEENLEQLAGVLQALHERGGWLVLPSPTAIHHFSELLARIQIAPQLLDGLRIATIGRAGHEALERNGIPLDFLPPHPRAASLAETLPLDAPVTPVIILGSAQTRPELPDGLERRGARVQVLPLYAPRPYPTGLKALREMLANAPPGLPQLICVTSPSVVDAIANEFQLRPRHVPAELMGKGWVAIGPTTAASLKNAGISSPAIAEATEPTAEKIVAAAEKLALRFANTFKTLDIAEAGS